ncbi:MAG TPA: methyltransferase [Gemmatimonadaceae bacterium]|nr:methyltransferase [Gemmatimonadaceae bacterium]
MIEQDVSPSALPEHATNARVPGLSAPSIGMPSLLDEAWRLEPFVHPFTFSAFFSPEDTLLCVLAADAARTLLPDASPAIAELTSGSGLIGLYLILRDRGASLLGLDIDSEAARVAESNARLLGVSSRARFARSDLWAASTLELLKAAKPQLLVCNPPYVPEPPGTTMQIEAGAGPHGTAHLLRALELARALRPEALALSWCSLSDPAAVVTAAEAAGYQLAELYVSAIADGEYSGSVHWYLRNLKDCFINEQPETLEIIATDGSARFAYLLFAGAFRRSERPQSASSTVRGVCEDFARDGVRTLAGREAPFPLHCSLLTRWDELRLRMLLHGEIPRAARTVT